MDSFMTPQQYRNALQVLELSIVGAAPLLGISRRQSQRYAAGAPVPEPIARLLTCYLAHGVPSR